MSWMNSWTFSLTIASNTSYVLLDFVPSEMLSLFMVASPFAFVPFCLSKGYAAFFTFSTPFDYCSLGEEEKKEFLRIYFL
jgi:hypothetical protein